MVAPLPPLVVQRGIVSRPMSWSELESAVREQRWCGLGRLAHVQEEYNKHKLKVKSGGQTMGSFIQQQIFKQRSNQTERDPPSPPASAAGATPDSASLQLVWTPNAFPYGAESGVHHELLWCIQTGPDASISEDRLKAEVQARFPSHTFDTICWVNPIENRSIKVRHTAGSAEKRAASARQLSSNKASGVSVTDAPTAFWHCL